MRALMQSFLVMLATATDRQLAKQVQFLKAENSILRGRLGSRVLVTPRERRKLLRFGKPVGKAIKELISIVTPRTFLGWVNNEKKVATGCRKKKNKPGRAKTLEQIRQLVIRMAKENGWGLGRILGELKKLGSRYVRVR